MQLKLSFIRRLVEAGLAAVLICALLTVGAASSWAQSGRRPPKQPTSPNPLPPKQEEPPIKPASEDDSKSLIPIKVGWQLRDVSASSIYSKVVQDGCLERLSQARSVKPGTIPEMNRKQASDLAKRSSGTYVVWFELHVDIADDSRVGMGHIPSRYLFVRFEVFSPGTGKTKTSGQIYQRPRGPGGLPIPTPAPQTPGAAEYSLRYAGREMADRVLSSLSISRPADRP